jgi:protein TonB
MNLNPTPAPRAVSPPGPASLSRLCLAQDEERGARHLAWVNAICAVTLLAALAGNWAGSGAAPGADTASANPTPVELILRSTEPATPTTTDLAMDAPLVQEPADIAIPTVAAVVQPVLTAPITVTQAWAAFATPITYPGAPAIPSQVGAESTSRFEGSPGDTRTPQPAYPRLALQRGQTGTVRIEFIVAENGAVAQAEVTRSSGHPMLDAAALNTVRARWQFPPGAGRRHFVDIVFQLRPTTAP